MSKADSSTAISPPLPRWARASGTADLTDATLRAGACLGRLDTLARGPSPVDQLWRHRLALTAATASMRLIGRREDGAALRDGWMLRSDGTDPGPGGQIYGVWRTLTDRSSVLTRERWQRLEILCPRRSGNLDLLADRVDEIVGGSGNPIAIAARVVTTTLALQPAADVLALWLADWTLAHRCGWPCPVPLLAPFLRRPDLRGATDAEAATTWLTILHEAVACASIAAVNLHTDLQRRAEHLIAATPSLRAKGAPRVIARLLEDDAISPSHLPGMGDRAGRRLVDRLVELDAIRELTGRTTFRLYGL